MTNPAEMSKTNPNEFRITQLLFESEHAFGNTISQLSATQDSISMTVPVHYYIP